MVLGGKRMITKDVKLSHARSAGQLSLISVLFYSYFGNFLFIFSTHSSNNLLSTKHCFGFLYLQCKRLTPFK